VTYDFSPCNEGCNQRKSPEKRACHRSQFGSRVWFEPTIHLKRINSRDGA